jgi:ligand-binding sensor domain-containing protein/signal transduction histidine kinase
LTGSSCRQSNHLNIPSTILDNHFKMPLAVKAGKPEIIHLIDRKPPVVVKIPVDSGAFSLRKSENGARMVQSLPPAKTKAGFYIPMQKFSIENGMPSNMVRYICGDKKGNVWFGHNSGGLSRYNGQGFEVYSVNEGLSTNNIRVIFEDSKGNIWIGKSDGLSCFNGRNFIDYSVKDGLLPGDEYAIAEDDSGNIHIGTIYGVSIFNGKTFSTTYLNTVQGIEENAVLSICILGPDDVLYGSLNGLYRKTSKGLYRLHNSELPNNQILSMCRDHLGNLWIGTYSGLLRVERNALIHHGSDDHFYNPGGLIRVFNMDNGLPGNIVSQVIEDSLHNIWAATFSGIALFDSTEAQSRKDSVTIRNFTTNEGLMGNAVQSVYSDNHANIWIASDMGVNMMERGPILTTYTTQQGLLRNGISSIIQDRDSNYWISTDGGISVLGKDAGSFTNYTTAQGLVDYLSLSLILDKEGVIWFTTDGSGVSFFDRNKKMLTTYKKNQGLISNYLCKIFQENNGRYWFASYMDGVSCFDGKSFFNYTTKQGLPVNRIMDVAEDKTGNIWFATQGGGVSCFNGDQFINYGVENGLVNNVVYNVFIDSADNIWCGTENGVSRIDASRKGITNYQDRDGLSANTIFDINGDSFGNIWVGTRLGLTKIKGFAGENRQRFPATNRESALDMEQKKASILFDEYSIKTGYAIGDITINSMWFDPRGRLWFGADNKLVCLDPGKILQPVDPPNVFIRKVTIDGETLSWQDLYASHIQGLKTGNTRATMAYAKRNYSLSVDSMLARFGDIKFDSISPFYPLPLNLVLPINHGNIAFSFVAVEPSKPTSIEYRYKLDGFNEEWQQGSPNGEAEYNNLKEGEYTFLVSAMRNKGEWSIPVQYSFKILPPWQRTWWAYSIYFLVAMLLITGYNRFRSDKLRKQNVLLENIVETKTTELRKTLEEKHELNNKIESQKAVMNERLRIGRELHDEVGATLSGISMYSHLSSSQMESSKFGEVKKSLAVIQQSAGEMVNKLNDIVWLVNPAHDSLKKMMQRLEDYAVEMAGLKNMQVKAEIPDEEGYRFSVEAKKDIYLFCKEAINNAVKYSDGSLLKLELNRQNGCLEFSVTDNGKGFDPSVVKLGNGIHNMEARAKEIGATFILESGKDEGCRVAIRYKIT